METIDLVGGMRYGLRTDLIESKLKEREYKTDTQNISTHTQLSRHGLSTRLHKKKTGSASCQGRARAGVMFFLAFREGISYMWLVACTTSTVRPSRNRKPLV